MRAKDRTETEEPMIAKSRIDKVEANFHKPINAREAPIRLKLRNDIEDPRCKQSKIDIVDPRRAYDRSANDEPSITLFSIETDELNRQ